MINRMMRLSGSKVVGFLAVALLLSSGAGICNQYKELTLSQKVDASDTVLIARVASVYKNGCLKMNSCARLKILTVLKGKSSENMAVLFDGPIAESDPLCCEVGHDYLFFLKRVNGIYYQSSNGPFGVYLVK